MTNPFRDHKKFIGTNDEYLSLLETEYFSVCKDQTVLEIGPFGGHHSTIIVKHNPKSFEVIEPYNSVQTREKLATIDGIDKIIVDDALLVLSAPRPYNVVVCFGLLYHLHSPIHLLELIVNHCRPKYILLDSVGKFNEEMTSGMLFDDEPAQEPGTRQVRTDFKFSGLKLMCAGSVFQLVMNRLGYKLIKSYDLAVTDNFSKSNSWVAMWRNEE